MAGKLCLMAAIAAGLAACAPPDFPDSAWEDAAAELSQPRIVPIAPILEADPPAEAAETTVSDLTDQGDALRERADDLRSRDP